LAAKKAPFPDPIVLSGGLVALMGLVMIAFLRGWWWVGALWVAIGLGATLLEMRRVAKLSRY
jgi:hypothetical protein